MRWGNTVRDTESQLGHQPVEYLARAARMSAASAVEAEQRILIRSVTALDLAGEQFADARPVRNQAAFSELAAAHRQELSPSVNVADAEAARFPRAQSQSVAEGEDGVVGRPAADGPRVVGKCCGGLQQPAGQADVEEER